MSSVSLDDLLEKIPNKFNLVMVTAKRARQIKDGAPRLVPTQSVNPVTVAMEEIIAEKIVLSGNEIHLIDDFGQPIRSAPDRLEELLALPGELDAGDPFAALSRAETPEAEPAPVPVRATTRSRKAAAAAAPEPQQKDVAGEAGPALDLPAGGSEH